MEMNPKIYWAMMQEQLGEEKGLVKGGLEELSKETDKDRRETAQSKGHVSAGSQ